MKNFDRLETRLKETLTSMKAAWVEKGSGYESQFAKTVGAKLDKQTYWDMQIDGFKIEVKKGQRGAWFDLTRYCDLPKKTKEWDDIITLFLHYEKGSASVKSIIGTSLTDLMRELHLTEEAQKAILRARSLLIPDKDSRLNFQSRLTVDELRKIARHTPNFVIPKT